MKIAISSTGKNLESGIDSRFGRCQYFIIAEIENDKIKGFEVIENIAANQQGGAGMVAAQCVAKQKITTVISTNVGPRAMDVLKQFKIKIFKAEGIIQKAIEDFISNKLVSEEIKDS